MNKVILIGRLTRDPELRYTGSNTPVATFSLAVNRSFTNQNGEREADFINCVVWRKLAETVKNYLSQGSQVAVEGRIQTRNYDDQNGQRRYVTEVVVENIDFVGTKRDNSQSSNQPSFNSQPVPSNFNNLPLMLLLLMILVLHQLLQVQMYQVILILNLALISR